MGCGALADVMTSDPSHHSQSNNNEQMTSSLHATKGLYGRKAEEHVLHAAYHRRSSPQAKEQPELVIVTGVSGSGKTTLAKSLAAAVQADGGFFVSGKFDQLQQPEPYAPFVTAFTEWSDQLITKEAEHLDVKGGSMQAVRKRVLDCVGADASRLLVDTIPALADILLDPAAYSCSTEKAASSKAENNLTGAKTEIQKRRFFDAFCGLLRAISSPEHPLVLFLDDLQWADQGSLDLLAALLQNASIHEGFMLLGACRGDEVSLHDPLSVTLRALEDNNVTITNIALHDFTKEEVYAMMSTMFPMKDESSSKPFAEIMFDETRGNIFFMLQLAKRLQEEDILTLDESDKHAWHLDLGRMRETIVSEGGGDVVEMVEGELQLLPEHVKSVLQIAACLGASYRIQHLDIVLPDLDVCGSLQIAAERGIIHYKSGSKYGKFLHDKMQEATYSLIPEESLPSIHALIGLGLFTGLSKTELERDIFLVVNQAGGGIGEIQDPHERNRLAELCLRAGKKAVASSAFVASSAYLNLGIRFLSPDHWRDEYYLSLALFNAAAEVEYCNANFEQTNSLLHDIFLNARSFDDKIQAYNTHVFALGAQERFQEAIHTGFKVLRELGEPFPSNPSKFRIALEAVKTKWMLRWRSDDQILDLPMMADPRRLAALQMINLLYLYVIFTMPEHVPLLCTRVIRRTLKYGRSGVSCIGFATYGMLLCGARNDYDGGYKYSRLALKLMDRLDSKVWIPRVYVPVFGMVFHSKQPIRTCLKPLQTAHRVGFETGDIEFAMMAVVLYFLCASFSGVPIPTLYKEMVSVADKLRIYKQEAVLSLLLPFLQAYSNHMGKAKNHFVLTGDHMDEEAYVRAQTEAQNTTNLALVHSIHAETYYHLNCYELAEREAKSYRRFTVATDSSLGAFSLAFYEGLIASELARRSRQREHLKLVRQSMKRLRKWAKCCPDNFLPHCSLLEAELTVLKGDVDNAVSKYESAVNLAEKEGFLPIQAIACERLSATLRHVGRKIHVNKHLKEARDLYEAWGFQVKVDQLDEALSGNGQV